MDSVIASQQSNMDYLLKAKNLKGISLLLVEDDSFNQIVAVDTLESLIPEIKITIAENGLLACEKAQSEKFDIVLMDLQMPELNGYEATEKIRQFSSIPIIAMTADALKTDNDKCLAVGMNDYISKPFEEANLIDKIYKQVNK
jgi:CheY-like chemotaxis protein